MHTTTKNTKKQVLLMILDGYGISKNKTGNAVMNAKTPYLDQLQSKYPHIEIKASGTAVGLPKGQIGNSEVGHLHIGAGRVIYTGLSLINKSIMDKTFEQNKALLNAIKHAKTNKSKFHVMGLFSTGGVHSSLNHILAILNVAHKHKVKTVLHIFGDGRDVRPQRILLDLKKTLPNFKKMDVTIGTISGRYYAMDRDQRWERINKYYLALVEGKANKFKDPILYIKEQYSKKNYDEFLEPAVNISKPIEAVTLQDNDAVFFANFRPDRARQLSHFIFKSKYYKEQPKLRRKNIYFLTMMQYEGIKPSAIAFPQINYKNTLGEVIAKQKRKQLRIAETEKYAHVTFFFDGGKEVNYPLEKKILIPSNKLVKTYDLAPEMSCKLITDKLINEIGKYDLIVLNYANPDMVGHTGNYEATIKALEKLDLEIGRLIKICEKNNVTLFFTADHGNAEAMIDENKKPITKHTANMVPFACTDTKIKFIFNKNSSLANVAPTILDYLGIKTPKEMSEKSLIKTK
ncbi:2,3-bisphosphoglycerate-independent phosphoglycerate mutase [Mycoplasmoides alvi]|uniref:2,3-bisphosphoglycerate-independent phosphoglycerate mutase n=1 Tax=Mycoplasmoides alvi TaxID=78580 RepID=UPI00051B1890|nr:2,3-bisphosphoglycerate-independent phosphoglycerate mutase [Mycoplasmoides alvi]